MSTDCLAHPTKHNPKVFRVPQPCRRVLALLAAVAVTPTSTSNRRALSEAAPRLRYPSLVVALRNGTPHPQDSRLVMRAANRL